MGFSCISELLTDDRIRENSGANLGKRFYFTNTDPCKELNSLEGNLSAYDAHKIARNRAIH